MISLPGNIGEAADAPLVATSTSAGHDGVAGHRMMGRVVTSRTPEIVSSCEIASVSVSSFWIGGRWQVPRRGRRRRDDDTVKAEHG
jgi:hypothetical protein